MEEDPLDRIEIRVSKTLRLTFDFAGRSNLSAGQLVDPPDGVPRGVISRAHRHARARRITALHRAGRLGDEEIARLRRC